jgi:hypothetical protein
MPRHDAIAAAKRIVAEASPEAQIDLLADLAEPLAEYMLLDYKREDWQDSPFIEPLARVAALWKAQGRNVPPAILSVLRNASEAGRRINESVRLSLAL